MNIEQHREPREPEARLVLSGVDVELPAAPINPEAYKGCLVQAMRAANMGEAGEQKYFDFSYY